MQAVIYTRVSTDEQAKNGLSLEGQEKAARDYCRQEGLEVAEIFTDAGESAKTANRPQLIAAVAYCKDHYKDIDYFVVWKLDRFARNTEDHVIIDSQLQKLGIQLRSVTEPITDTPLGNLTKTMLAGFAQFDNDVRAERSSNGVKRRIEQGGWPHMAPVGYTNIKDSLGRPTLAKTEQADLIGGWLREFLKGGHTSRDMSQMAWDIGIRSKQGKRLSYQQTCNMLRNPIYAGLVYSKMIEAPIKGLHEALITFEEHEEILDKLEGRQKSKHAVKGTQAWPLRGGFIKCADCGESITGSSPKGRSKNYPKYHCAKCRSRTVGHTVSVDRDRLHHEFEALLEDVTPSEATLKLFREVVIRKYQNIHIEQRDLQQSLQQDLEKLRDRKQKIITLFIDGNLTVEEKQEQTKKLETDILRTELKLSEMKGQVLDSEVLIDFGINMIQSAPKLWRIAGEVERQRLQATIFPEGLSYDFINGFGTAKTDDLYGVLQQFDAKSSNVVGVVGFEPTTNQL